MKTMQTNNKMLIRSGSPNRKHVLDTIIIGGGPAGCGLLTNFALNGEYNDFLNRGVVVVESSSRLGGGSLDHYNQLMSNSHGSAFFDAFEDLGLVDSHVHDKSLNRTEVIPMSDLHLLQDALGAWHHANLSRHPVSQALTNATVVDVKEQDDGTYCVRYMNMNADADANENGSEGSTVSELVATNVCICTGGKPYNPSWIVESKIRNLEAANEYFQGTRTPNPEAKRIAIVGFSHSAFSLGHLWNKRSPHTQITYITRNKRSVPPMSPVSVSVSVSEQGNIYAKPQPYIYFPSTQEANAAQYPFRNVDVCPETNRVHRFGGLRGDAREFALQKHLFTSMPAHDCDFEAEDFDHVIVACGYQINSVPILDRNGVTMEPEYGGGGTKVDSHGRLFGTAHNIYAFGVGAGLSQDEKIGGEPGCTRRSDGIWLYQYTVGSVIRTSLKEGSARKKRERKSESCEKENVCGQQVNTGVVSP